MTPLSPMDRFFRGVARYVENPMLRLVGPQPILRRIFALTAPLGSRILPGTTLIRKGNALHIRPPGVARNAPVLLYIHGGGFTIGSPRTHAALISRLAKSAGMRAVAPGYGLAPERPFPAAQQDCIAAYEALCAEGTPPVAVCGDSAGGCLVLQVACHARDAGLPMPSALGLIGPIADLSGDISARFTAAEDEILIPPEWVHRINECYLPGVDPTDPAVSPLLGDLSGLPPTLLQAAREEALAEDANRLAEAMPEATLDLWPGLQHVWHLHAGRAPAADRALSEMGAFLARHAGTGAAG